MRAHWRCNYIQNLAVWALICISIKPPANALLTDLLGHLFRDSAFASFEVLSLLAA